MCLMSERFTDGLKIMTEISVLLVGICVGGLELRALHGSTDATTPPGLELLPAGLWKGNPRRQCGE